MEARFFGKCESGVRVTRGRCASGVGWVHRYYSNPTPHIDATPTPLSRHPRANLTLLPHYCQPPRHSHNTSTPVGADVDTTPMPFARQPPTAPTPIPHHCRAMHAPPTQIPRQCHTTPSGVPRQSHTIAMPLQRHSRTIATPLPIPLPVPFHFYASPLPLPHHASPTPLPHAIPNSHAKPACQFPHTPGTNPTTLTFQSRRAPTPIARYSMSTCLCHATRTHSTPLPLCSHSILSHRTAARRTPTPHHHVNPTPLLRYPHTIPTPLSRHARAHIPFTASHAIPTLLCHANPT